MIALASFLAAVVAVFSFIPGCEHKQVRCVARELGPVQTTPWGSVREVRCTRWAAGAGPFVKSGYWIHTGDFVEGLIEV